MQHNRSDLLLRQSNILFQKVDLPFFPPFHSSTSKQEHLRLRPSLIQRCLNPIIHGWGRGGGQKMPTLISKICIFATNTATATTFGD